MKDEDLWTKKRCRARFVEANGQWHKCVLLDDGHDLHIALLHGRTFDADIRWTKVMRHPWSAA